MQAAIAALKKMGISSTPYSYVLDTSLTASQTAKVASLNIDQDSDFIVRGILGSRTGSYECQIKQAGTGQAWQSTFVRDTNFVGTAKFPNYLLTPQVLHGGSKIDFNLNELSGSGNTIQLVLLGQRVYGSIPSEFFKEVWYQLATGRQTLSGNASTVFNLQVDKGYDFMVRKIVAEQTGTFLMRITDVTTGQYVHKKMTNNVNAAGTAQNPLVLPTPLYLKNLSTVAIELQDTSGSSNVIDVVLEGTAIFR